MLSHPVTQALIKIAINHWYAILYLIIGLAVLGRWESNEKKRLEKIAKRQKARRVYSQKHIS